ncbi:MAG: hypothetical protein ACYSSO_13380, partial [Planctomycetota bacterium]
TFWMQMLVLVVLGALVGLGYLIKTRPNRYKGRRWYHPGGTRSMGGQLHRQIEHLKESTSKSIGFLLKTAKQKFVAEENISGVGTADATDKQKFKSDLSKKAKKDLAGGMELLELDFLLGVVENTNGNGKNDVMIRKLSFNELLRRKKLSSIGSSALKVYAKNAKSLYGKEIQCGAMNELSQRTVSKSKRGR